MEGEEVPVGRAPKDEVGEALGARGGGRRLRVEPGGNGGSEPGCVRLQAGALCVERDRDGGAVVERRQELRLHRVDVREVVAGQPLRKVDVEDGLVVPRFR